MRIGSIMLVQRSLDLLRPLSSHGKRIDGKLNSPLTLLCRVGKLRST